MYHGSALVGNTEVSTGTIVSALGLLFTAHGVPSFIGGSLGRAGRFRGSIDSHSDSSKTFDSGIAHHWPQLILAPAQRVMVPLNDFVLPPLRPRSKFSGS